MPRVRCWTVDAFTNRAFGGNAAAVCWLEREADAEWMQNVAAEMNLSETAFVRPLNDGLELRWFTPEVEVDLCGHATLATSHAILSAGLVSREQPLRYHTRSGVLTCTVDGDFLELDFPALPATEVEPPPGLLQALRIPNPLFVGRSKFDYLVEVESPDAVRAVNPDYAMLREVPTRGIMVTARSHEPPYDFASRFFAPSVGINEDPVCGSAHCTLGPYWAAKIGKTELLAQQVSKRIGILRLRMAGDRVKLGGQAVTVWEGELLDSPV